jgi:hydroxyquinol 1,2-dioxygenase
MISSTVDAVTTELPAPRHITLENITEVVLRAFSEPDSARLGTILRSLVRHIHAFARETRITHEEWRAGLDLLRHAGEITNARRNEFILLSDIFGLSSLVDLLHSLPGETEGSVLGPFYLSESPLLPTGADVVRDNPGTPVHLHGRVLDSHGTPIPGAMIDFWQNADNGLYPSQDPSQRPDNLRCRIVTDDGGRYALKTIRPRGYIVPDDGPVGEILRRGGRRTHHMRRPAHYHFMVTAEGYRPIITELFDDEADHIGDDAIFAVRESIIVHFSRNESVEDARALGLRSPYCDVEYDFRLRKLAL